METRELVTELTRRGVALRVSEGRIQYSAPQDVMTPEMKSALSRFKSEILTLYSGSQIHNALERIADVWCADIECQGEGDAAWAFIKASDYWQLIKGAEDKMNGIGSRGDPDELNAACAGWIALWVEAIAAWSEAYMHKTRIVQPGSFCEGKR